MIDNEINDTNLEINTNFDQYKYQSNPESKIGNGLNDKLELKNSAEMNINQEFLNIKSEFDFVKKELQAKKDDLIEKDELNMQ